MSAAEPGIAASPTRRGLLRAPLLTGFLWLEARLDSLFGVRWNPLYQLGALGFFYYWIVAVSGIYIYIFFDTGTTAAYRSVEALTHGQWYLGGVLRSLHRYASDGLVLMMAVHLLREYALGHLKGPRWFSWITGLPIVALVLVSGISGYWLVWDEMAQYVAIATAEWFDWLGIFGEPIARNFLSPQTLDDRFFTLLMFVHIVVPLMALLALWIHLQRISKPVINPSRGLAIGTFVMLLVLSFVVPAESHPPADLARVASPLALDWFYLAVYPLMDVLSNGGVWALLLTASLALAILPWLPPRWAPKPAVVHLESCNGCGRCAEDCPYQAILMRPRSDGLPFEQEAVVDEALCVSCGICAGACPAGHTLSPKVRSGARDRVARPHRRDAAGADPGRHRGARGPTAPSRLRLRFRRAGRGLGQRRRRTRHLALRRRLAAVLHRLCLEPRSRRGRCRRRLPRRRLRVPSRRPLDRPTHRRRAGSLPAPSGAPRALAGLVGRRARRGRPRARGRRLSAGPGGLGGGGRTRWLGPSPISARPRSMG